MPWNHYVSYFFGGFVLANAVPHFVAGMMGKPLQSPFAKPSGKGYSSSTVNAAWGWFNLVIAYLLLFQVGHFDIGNIQCAAPPLVAALLGSLQLSRHFGAFNGGNRPLEEQAANAFIPKGS
jgi:hypothetical protein